MSRTETPKALHNDRMVKHRRMPAHRVLGKWMLVESWRDSLYAETSFSDLPISTSLWEPVR